MSTISPSSPLRQNSPLPPLENGDRLTRGEFRRRWQAMPQLKRAELIEGVVYMAAAVRHRQHGRPQGWVLAWLGQYAFQTPGIDFGDNATVGLDDANDPQPDAYLLLPPAVGGLAKETADGYLEGPPAFIAEVAASSSSIDLHDKFAVYQRHGVREYLIWRVLDNSIDWFVLDGGVYQPLPVSADGSVRSQTFPGLWLNLAAMLSGDGKGVYATLAEGLATPEHAAFAARLIQA